MSLLDLTNRRILLTGGCGAIGLHLVKALSDQGAFVIVNDILPEKEAYALLEDHEVPGATREYRRADVTQLENVRELFSSLSALPDTVCCHAGMTKAAPIQEYPLEQFDALFALNLRAAFLVAQEASKMWLAAGKPGHLIFTSSWVQDVPWPDITPYNASKAGLKMLMRGFARELAPNGIRANAVAPGIVAVGMAKNQYDTDPEYGRRARKAIPLGHLQTPESVSDAFLFLCSDMAAYMTGSVLLVDGGASLYPMDTV